MLETRALLLTDVVDSTQLAERLGDVATAELWARHDRLARDLLRPHRGREIDKTDGLLLLFESAGDAVAYALAYHAALRGLDLTARVGLHVGPVALRENPAADVALGAKPLELEGLAKPTAARVMSLAVGGQTLLTADARSALGATPLRVASHGHWRIKGLSEPVELFEVGGDNAPFTPPPDGAKVYRVVRQGDLWLPARQVKHSLPRERDAFVGRDADLQNLARRLEDGASLVSVLGGGGTGKTRLVVRYGWRWLGDWPGGIWFCDLSKARSLDGIVYAVARALDVPLGKDDPVVQLGHAIAGRGRCLVVLDNFEQVSRHAMESVGRWLDRASEAQFVVTTREVLGLPGETALALAPLQEADAVALFEIRAAQAKQDFELTDAERPHVLALVKLLDGLPLAIELAAARVRVMLPKELIERMSERFKLLASSGGRQTRQATLRATIDWSWNLLSSDEQAALAQLSVFEGGFTLASAEAVLSLAQMWPTDVVQALVDKSLVRPVSDQRFDLLVSVQKYAAERLDASLARAATEARHGRHYAVHGTDEALDALDRRGGVKRRQALSSELDNLVAASRRAVARGDGEVAAAALGAAWAVLGLRGPIVVAADLAALVLGLATLSPPARGAVARVLGGALHVLGRGTEARAHYDAALGVAREVGNRRNEGGVLSNLGNLHLEQGRMDEARAQYDAALVAAREVGNRCIEGGVLNNLGNLHLQQGRIDEARAHYDAALVVAREVGDGRTEGSVLDNLGSLHMQQQGRLDEARAHYDAALAVAREVGSRSTEGNVLGNLGNLHLQQGRMDVARAHFEAALVVAREVGNRRNEGNELSNLGALHLEQGRMDEARAHLDAALVVAREVGDRRNEGYVLCNLGALHLEQGRMDEARASFAAFEALLREAGDPNELAMLLCQLARLEQSERHAEVARATLVEAEALAVQVGAGADSDLGRELVKTRLALDAG